MSTYFIKSQYTTYLCRCMSYRGRSTSPCVVANFSSFPTRRKARPGCFTSISRAVSNLPEHDNHTCSNHCKAPDWKKVPELHAFRSPLTCQYYGSIEQCGLSRIVRCRFQRYLHRIRDFDTVARLPQACQGNVRTGFCFTDTFFPLTKTDALPLHDG